MAVFDSPVTTYSDTTPHKRVITDYISLIDPTDAPAIEALGGLDGASSKFRFVNGPGKVVEWLEDDHLPLADSINGSITSVATTVTLHDSSPVQEGHIIAIDDEQMWVSDVNTTTQVVTVSRSFGGTTNASHADDAAAYIVGMARLEGDDSDDIAFTDRYVGSNWTQILHQEVKVTRTQNQIAQYGISEEMAYQGDKAVPNLMRLLERHFYYNAAGSAGSSTTPRTMTGVRGFITDNTLSGASLTQAKLEDAVELAYVDGGSGPWTAFVSPTNYQKIKNLYDSSAFLRIDRAENTLGMVIEKIVTPFGIVNLVLDRWARNTEIPLVDETRAGFVTLYPFTQEPLAKGGDYEKSQVVGEFTFCLKNAKAHAILTAVS